MPDPDHIRSRWSDAAVRVIPPDPVLGTLAAVLIITSTVGHAHGLNAWFFSSAAAFVCGGAVAVRGRWPLGALVVSALTLLAAHLLGGRADVEDVSLLAETVLLYTVASRAAQREAIIGLVLVTVAALALQTLESGFDPAPPLVVLLPAFFIGRALRHWRLLTATLDERAAELEASREAFAALAVRDERMRIARELHDVVGHAISLMVIQASAGRRVADTRPDAALTALDAIDDAGTQALDELSRLTDLLEPTPRSLTELVASARAAGLHIHLGDEASLMLSPLAFRVVQESLTNILKHAGETHVSVDVRAEEDQVEIRVTDRGPADESRTPVANTFSTGGQGLTGMRDRVALAGGTLTAGPGPSGGWEVRAWLPQHPLPVA